MRRVQVPSERAAAENMATAMDVDVRTLRSRAAHGGKPEVCGFYSLDGQRRYRGDLSQLRYLRLPGDDELARGFDLDVGTDAALARDDARPDPKLDNLLTWLRDPRVDKDHLSSNPEIVTNRRTLLVLMHTSFEKPNWTVTAKLFDGVIFLFSTWRNEWPETEDNRRRSMWGLKFEEYITTGQFRGEAAVAEDPTVLDPKFYAIFTYRTGNHRVLYGAEIDCVESTRSVRNLRDLQRTDTRFIEFKTNKIIRNKNQWGTMIRNKFPKWWEQCHLTNIDKVVCGFRTDRGIVNKMDTFTTQEMLNGTDQRWDPKVCLNFMDKALSFIKRVTLSNTAAGTFWEFEATRPSHGDLETVRLTARRRHEDAAGGDVLLPRWFTGIDSNPSDGSQCDGPKLTDDKIRKKLTKLAI